MMSWLLGLVPAIPLAGAAAGVVRRSPASAARATTVALGLASVLAIVVLLVTGFADGPIGGSVLRADRAMALLLVVVLGTATVVSSFAARSLDRDDRTVGFFAATAALVAGSTLVLLAGSPVVLAVGWIGSGWALVHLIGFDRSNPGVGRARRRIVRSLAAGDVALVAALALAATSADRLLVDPSASADQLRNASMLGLPRVDVVAILLVVAGLSRSAVLPFHRWLGGTLVAPTPVSALVHAGFVSGAGLLLVRLADVFVASDTAVLLAFACGAVTVVLASAVSSTRADVKGALAWSTVAQMAFMVIQCAVGAFSSAVIHIAGHGMYKAARFLGAGDTVSAAVRASRTPLGGEPVPAPLRRGLALVVPAVAVAVALVIVPPQVNDAGRLLVAVFAWATGTASLSSWLVRHPGRLLPTVAGGVLAAFGATLAYFGALRLGEEFLKPAVGSPVTVVSGAVLVAVLSASAAIAIAAVLAARSRLGVAAGIHRLVTRWSRGAVPLRSTTDVAGDLPTPDSIDDSDRARIRSEVSRAAAIVAPLWPLSSFVAVNPLGGLEAKGFDGATAQARTWLRARTHLSLSEYRSDHERGLTRLADLEYVVHDELAEVCARAAMPIAGRLVPPVDVIVADLLHGPETAPGGPARTMLERSGLTHAADLVDDVLAAWLAEYVSHPVQGERFVAASRRLAAEDPHLTGALPAPLRDWFARLPDDPATVIAMAFATVGVGPDDRVDEMRGHLARLAGWSGLAKWRNEWAPADDARPPLAPADIVAVRAALEAVVLRSIGAVSAADADAAHEGRVVDDTLDDRVRAVAAVLAPTGTTSDHEAIRRVLTELAPERRAALWLRAQERCFDERMLSVLDRVDPGRTVDRPDAQAVFCIDVRSEGIRRHLEDVGQIETLGFAGFFGLTLNVRRAGWDHAEPRCPVLVAPSLPAVEVPRPDAIDAVAGRLAAERRRAGVIAAHDGAKKAPGAPFVLAEALGWLSGPRAAWRTLVPPRVTEPSARSTRVALDESVLAEQRVFAAESVLRTMGLTERFAPLVLLCGHTSRTVNNPHATALECGACGGASGDDNAMAVAALLNSPDVRAGLPDRGIDIPDDTWFVAGLHDTASDHVVILDAAAAPVTHHERLRLLQSQLHEAGLRQAADRARHLPGPARRVRDRGVDWAQARPEWGLARAAAFVIGPRSLTAGLDLDGRAFLHGYDADRDPTGRVLETIMTAPLVVAHWIASQYYFSTVDPEVFGAGDKLMHNPVGSIGVVTGEGGDLRVGLPLQSTHVDGRRHHQPIRLLAVVQADLARVEEIIGRHAILQTLVGGSWLRIAARSHPHEPWSTRTPAGTWITQPRPFADLTTLTDDHTLEHAEMT